LGWSSGRAVLFAAFPHQITEASTVRALLRGGETGTSGCSGAKHQ